MPTKKQDTPNQVYQLKITLDSSKPPIWRRILVPAEASLASLHKMIQVVMGWSDAHLHQFIVDETYYGVPDDLADGPDEGDLIDEASVSLQQLVTAPAFRFLYEYDFGDNWLHEILVEEIGSAEAGKSYPICLAGEKKTPPEDCGGIWGFYDLLEAVGDPDHPEHEEMLDWLGEDFNQDEFDLPALNQQLKKIK
jgi:hypothetical protein